MTKQDAAREVRARHAVARVTERKEMSRVIAVRPDERQAVGGPSVRRVPTVVRLNSRNIRIDRRQLVHQLTGALNESLLPEPRRNDVAVCAGHEQLLVVDPADDVRRDR